MWVGLIQSAEGLSRTNTDLAQARRNSAIRLPLDQASVTSLAWQPRPSDFVLSKPPISCEPIPFNQSLSLSLCACVCAHTHAHTHTHTHTHPLLVLFLWRTLIYCLIHFTELLFRLKSILNMHKLANCRTVSVRMLSAQSNLAFNNKEIS